MDALRQTAEMLRPTIKAAATAAIANSPGLDMADAAQVTADVTREVAAVVVNQANLEPWYQSRVTLGAIVSIAVPALGALGVSADVLDADQLTALLMAAGGLAGGLVTLHGRWRAKKPLGA